jgi:potassium-transporting ATPase potassium-binding subunit
MNNTWLFILQALTIVVVLGLIYRPLGDYMAHVYTTQKNLKVERGFYRLIGVDPVSEQTWPVYLRSLLAFSLIGLLFLYLIQRIQEWLPLSLGLPPVEQGLAWNTAISFITNTNWQSYSPELTMGYTVQFAGLAVQNFASAAVGIAVAIALVRGLSRRKSLTIGNFWVDVTRGIVRILLPLSVVAAIILILSGVIQNFNPFEHVTTITGGSAVIPGGPVASQEAIKEIGTNGGGFFNVNSAHPFENPWPWTNIFEIILMLAIPFALPRTFGKMVNDNRQGYAIVSVMGIFWIASAALLTWLESVGSGTASQLAGGAMEGKETRFGIVGTSLFGTSATLTSTGAVDSMHDSFTSLGGGLAMLNMMLGEVAPGGVGSGLYGILAVAIVAVFVAGLMVGRTPEYLGKKLGDREIKMASIYILITPTIVLLGTALSFAIPAVEKSVTGTSMDNPGLHGYSEVLYAFTSAGNNNGSAFAGLTASTPWFDTALGVAMLLGRYLPIVFILALAGSLAAQDKIPVTAGTLPTHRPQFIGLLIGTILVVSALTYLPVLALGPLAEGLK